MTRRRLCCVGTIPFTMELRFDGERVVSGTVSGLRNPAEVKAAFDRKKGIVCPRQAV
jgi:hypothetical protein